MTSCNRIRFYLHIYYDLWFPFISLIAIINYFNIHAYITCIAHNLSVLEVIKKIKVIGSSQHDKLFIVDS